MASREDASSEELYLIDRFPTLFRQWHMTEYESCMGRGIEVESGWYHLLYEMSCELQALSDENALSDLEYTPIEYGQIKEKFGELRVYLDNCTDDAQAIVSRYETLSVKFCECCGSQDDVSTWGGWLKTMCRNCSEQSALERATELYRRYRQPNLSYSKRAPLTHSEAMVGLVEDYLSKARKKDLKFLPDGFPESISAELLESLTEEE